MYFRNWNRTARTMEKLFRILILTIYSRPSNCRTIEIETRQLFKKMHRCFFDFISLENISRMIKIKKKRLCVFFHCLKFPNISATIKRIQIYNYLLLDRKELNDAIPNNWQLSIKVRLCAWIALIIQKVKKIN